jgi:hypothetical protein
MKVVSMSSKDVVGKGRGEVRLRTRSEGSARMVALSIWSSNEKVQPVSTPVSSQYPATK